jgi:hypothetical protein
LCAAEFRERDANPRLMFKHWFGHINVNVTTTLRDLKTSINRLRAISSGEELTERRRRRRRPLGRLRQLIGFLNC